MRNILIVGAGRSASWLIRYLLDHAVEKHLRITIADLKLENAQAKTDGHPSARAIVLDTADETARRTAVKNADLIISMLPAHKHPEVAKDCLLFGKHLVTASYISDEMRELDGEAKAKGLIFLNEMGLDPGIDHMSAMKAMDGIRAKGGKITSFESYCGGLIAPESDDNLWQYKFTWAPRNVVLAGQGGAAKFRHNGQFKYIPYQQLFKRIDNLHVEGYGDFEAYANRDSLKYQSVYGLSQAQTLYRGTIRRKGYSAAWDVFVQLGMTDDSYWIDDSDQLSNRDFLELFLPASEKTVETRLFEMLSIEPSSHIGKKLEEIDLFSDKVHLRLPRATPAQFLEAMLTKKWTLKPQDKDMIVMYHKFGYRLDGKDRELHSSMVCLGEDQIFTAMAKTVGLPVAMGALAVLDGEISRVGVQLPVNREIYAPVLEKLEAFGIVFTEVDH